MFGDRPLSTKDVLGGEPDTVPIFTPSRNTSYALTPRLSVDALQLTVTLVPEAVAVTSVGTVGGSVATWHGGG